MIILNKEQTKAKRQTVTTPLFLLGLVFSFMLTACSSDGGKEPFTPPSVTQTLDEFINSKNFSGVVLVRRDDKDILRAAYGFSDKAANKRNTVDTRFRIGSLTKAFTALGVVQLKQDGLIANYSDPITTYLTTSPLNPQITIEQTLTHRSGIPDYLNVDGLDESLTYTPVELASLVVTKPLDFTPGSKYEYSNSNYIILGMLIEELTGQSYYDFMQLHIFNPLGLSTTERGKSTISGNNYAKGYTSSTQDTQAGFLNMSIPYASGALSSNLSDLQDWASSFEGLSLISQQEYNEIFANTEYGFGWATIPNNGLKTYWHTGAINGFKSSIFILPDEKGLVIVLSNVENDIVEDISKHILDTEF